MKTKLSKIPVGTNIIMPNYIKGCVYRLVKNIDNKEFHIMNVCLDYCFPVYDDEICFIE